MVDNHQDRMEEMLGVDITPTLQSLAAFLQRSEGGPELARLKIKFCTLCDSTAERPDTLTLKKDSHARLAILNIVSSWLKVASPRCPSSYSLLMGLSRTTKMGSCKRT